MNVAVNMTRAASSFLSHSSTAVSCLLVVVQIGWRPLSRPTHQRRKMTTSTSSPPRHSFVVQVWDEKDLSLPLFLLDEKEVAWNPLRLSPHHKKVWGRGDWMSSVILFLVPHTHEPHILTATTCPSLSSSSTVDDSSSLLLVLSPLSHSCWTRKY